MYLKFFSRNRSKNHCYIHLRWIVLQLKQREFLNSESFEKEAFIILRYRLHINFSSSWTRVQFFHRVISCNSLLRLSPKLPNPIIFEKNRYLQNQPINFTLGTVPCFNGLRLLVFDFHKIFPASWHPTFKNCGEISFFETRCNVPITEPKYLNL